MTETLEGARDAFTRHAWPEAIVAFAAADRDGGLSPEDLESLGVASWWAARPDDATQAFERSFAAYSEGGRPVDAARVAMELSYRAYRTGNYPVGAGWQARAERLLADEPESGVHARLGVFNIIGALVQVATRSAGSGSPMAPTASPPAQGASRSGSPPSAR